MPDLLNFQTRNIAPAALPTLPATLPSLGLRFLMVRSDDQRQTVSDQRVEFFFPQDFYLHASQADVAAFHAYITGWLVAWRTGQTLPGS